MTGKRPKKALKRTDSNSSVIIAARAVMVMKCLRTLTKGALISVALYVNQPLKMNQFFSNVK